jgi:V8-like Glu-specific endopeptidase
MELQHSLPSHSGLSGSPILTDDNEVIGIHKAGIVKKGYNVGVLINKEMINNLTKWSNVMNSNNKIEVT